MKMHNVQFHAGADGLTVTIDGRAVENVCRLHVTVEPESVPMVQIAFAAEVGASVPVEAEQTAAEKQAAVIANRRRL
jgi:hypothetical protein